MRLARLAVALRRAVRTAGVDRLALAAGARIVAIGVLAACLVLTTPAVANLLLGWQEAREPATACAAQAG